MAGFYRSRYVNFEYWAELEAVAAASSEAGHGYWTELDGTVVAGEVVEIVEVAEVGVEEVASTYRVVAAELVGSVRKALAALEEEQVVDLRQLVRVMRRTCYELSAAILLVVEGRAEEPAGQGR